MERNSPMMLFAIHYECLRDYEYCITMVFIFNYECHLSFLSSPYVFLSHDGKSFEIFVIRYGSVNVNWTIINFDLKLNRE